MCVFIDTLCQCCEIFRGLFYRNLFENLVKYNTSEVTRLLKEEPVSESLNDSVFQWEFDGEDKLSSSYAQIQRKTIVEQPRSLGARPKDSIKSGGARDNSVLQKKAGLSS
jgi:hypothetical protein